MSNVDLCQYSRSALDSRDMQSDSLHPSNSVVIRAQEKTPIIRNYRKIVKQVLRTILVIAFFPNANTTNSPRIVSKGSGWAAELTFNLLSICRDFQWLQERLS